MPPSELDGRPRDDLEAKKRPAPLHPGSRAASLAFAISRPLAMSISLVEL